MQTPPDLNADAQAEWNSVIAAIEAEGRQIKAADRSLLTLYARTWQTWHVAYQKVRQFGPCVKFPNGTVGQTPEYKCCKETATQLGKFLDQLGLTPASRNFDKTDLKKEVADDFSDL